MNTAISVDLKPDLKKRVKEVAKKHGLQMSFLVRMSLEAGIPLVEKSLGGLKDGKESKAPKS